MQNTWRKSVTAIHIHSELLELRSAMKYHRKLQQNPYYLTYPLFVEEKEKQHFYLGLYTKTKENGEQIWKQGTTTKETRK